MKARYPVTNPGSKDGFALAAALGVLVLLSVLVVIVFENAMASFRSGTADLGKSRTYYAAEAGAESAMAQLAQALEDAVLEDEELAMFSIPDIEGFSFDSFDITKIGALTTERVTDGPFTGLFSKTQVLEIYSQAADADFNSSAILVTAKAQAIPIFQFGVFFDKDLEITNGPRMDFDGWVHSNGNIYLSSTNQYFGDLITTPKNVYHDRKDKHGVLPGVWIDDATATDVNLNFDSRDTPDYNAFRTKSDDRFDNRLKTNAYAVDSLKVPLPEGVDALTVIQPRDDADGTLERGAKFAWKADWYINVDLSQLSNDNVADNANASNNLCGAGNGTVNGTDIFTHTREAGVPTPDGDDCEDMFAVWSDKWYEGRELRYVDVVDIDVDKLYNWVGNGGGRSTSILYITVSTAGANDPKGDGIYPIIRLIETNKLSAPMTFATNHPLYVQGHYNTDVWYPSALVGDALTFLSTAWDDSQHLNPTVVKPNAANTTVYSAVLAGHSGTPCDHEEPGCGVTSPYGGGLENFPRFLERWTGRSLTFRGSLVSLSFAQQATGLWGGAYYSPPIRDWEFDTRFDDPANMPPGTPVVGNVIHTAFRPVF